MRLTLDSSRKTLVPLQTEINLIRNYLMLEQVRFSSSFRFEIEVDEDLDEYVVMVPPMLIQPNLENAVLHGLRYLEDREGELNIEFRHEGDKLLVIITDNGVGRKKAAEIKVKNRKSHQGVSTEITRERIDLLSRSLDRKLDFKVEDLEDESGPSGTRVTLILPLIEDDGFVE